MANINFPSTVGMPIGTAYNDPISGIKYIWTGVYWDAQGADGLVVPPQREELMPIGAVLPFANGVIPDGWLPCDGTTRLRSAYPDLYNALCVAPGFTPQTFTVTNDGTFSRVGHNFKGGERIRLFTTGSLLSGLSVGVDYYTVVLTVDTFKVSLSKGGTPIDPPGTSQSGTHTYLQSLYGLGDGNTTFNLPDLRDEFIRGAGAISNVGAWKDESVGPHKHTDVNFSSSSFATENNNSITFNLLNNTWSATQNDNLSSGETRPRNVAMNYCIKAYKLVTNSDLVDVEDLVQPIQVAADAATWKLHSTVNVTAGQQVIEFNPLPTSAKFVKLTIIDLSPANANNYDIMLQLGNSTIYDAVVGHYDGSINMHYNESSGKIAWINKPGAIIYANNDGGGEIGNGSLELVRHGNTNTWLLHGSINDQGAPHRIHHSAGKIAMTAALNKLRILFNDGGAGNTGFDTGSVALWYL